MNDLSQEAPNPTIKELKARNERLLPSRLQHFRELSGIDTIKPEDVEGTNIAVIDDFGKTDYDSLEPPAPGFVAIRARLLHGREVASVLEPVYLKIGEVQVDLPTKQPTKAEQWLEVAGNFLRAVQAIRNLPDDELPNIVSMSHMTIWSVMKPVTESLQEEAKAKGSKWLYRQLKRLPKSIQPSVLKPDERIASWKEIEESLRSKVLTTIDDLRDRGVVFAAAVPNWPNDHQKKDDIWLLPTTHPGVIGVGGISPAQKHVPEADRYGLEDALDSYARMGYPELAQVTGISFWKSPYYVKPYIEGNSFATPMTAIGVGMIMNRLPEIKLIKDPSRRESIILDILGDATQPLPVREIAKTNDGEFEPRNTIANVLNLKKLKDTLNKKEEYYKQQISK